MNDLTEDERRAIIWLTDQNDVQRNIRKNSDGSLEVIAEHDLSGGQSALVRLLLDMSAPLHKDVRQALANALDPFDDSLLQLKKRPRRARGRPRHDTIEHDVRRAYDALTIPDAVESETRKSRVPAAGMKARKLTKKEAIARVGEKEGKGRTEIYETLNRARAQTHNQ
ncbi:MAG: hypothetical protein ACXW3J_08830 [Methylocystis sp.]